MLIEAIYKYRNGVLSRLVSSSLFTYSERMVFRPFQVPIEEDELEEDDSEDAEVKDEEGEDDVEVKKKEEIRDDQHQR